VDHWLSIGVDRVIIGTLAYNDVPTLNAILSKYGPGRIIVTVDYRNGMIMTKGWTKNEGVPILDAVKRLQDSRVQTVLATAVEFDGGTRGPDFATLRTIRASTSMQILASGGVRTAADIRELERMGVEGVVVGRALYEGTIDLAQLNSGVQ